MLEAAEDALRFAVGRSREQLDEDRMLLRALLQCIEVIGEAASRTTPEGRDRIPALPWREMTKMRNILAHVYWGIDKERIWETVRDDLPALAAALRAALEAWPEEGSEGG
jgi:uncharacterized protein with HEPN domain